MNNKFIEGLAAFMKKQTDGSVKEDYFYSSLHEFMMEHSSILANGLTGNDKALIKLNDTLSEKNKAFYEIVYALSEEKQETVEGYISATHDINAYQHQYHYMNGYRDCFKLLAYIGMFSDFTNLLEFENE